MEIKAEYIRDAGVIHKFRDEILAAPALAIDVETKSFDPLTGKLRLLQVATGPERGFIFDCYHVNPNELLFLKDKIEDKQTLKLFQNGKFDVKFLMQKFGWQYFPALYDTYLASVLIACGDDNIRHGLGVLAENFAGIELDKQYGGSDWDEPELSEEQLAYAIRDSCVLFPIREKQNKFLDSLDLQRVALLEFDCVEAVAALELKGIYLNREHWQERLDRQSARHKELETQTARHFQDIVPVSIFGEIDVDLDSPVKLLPLLKKLGVPLTGGTMEDELTPFVNQFPVVKDLLDYREMATALKMFGPDYLDFINPVDGRIHADFRQIGTPTGRFTCNKPNLQQVPAEQEYRSSFQAQGPGRSLLIADYSMIELRIMAEFSLDEKMLEAFQNNIDLHQFTGSHAFGLPLEAAAKGTEQRQIGKMLNFGTGYGAAAPRFAAISGLPVKKAGEALAFFWNLYKGLDQYMKECEVRAVEENEVHSFSGRTWRLDYDPSDHKSIGAVQRIGRNAPIQGTCSDMMKRAMYFMRNETRDKDIDLVNVVHDEAVNESADELLEEAKQIISDSMIRAAEEILTRVPAKIDLNVSKVWQK
jgi:DNA polymerase I